MTDINKEFTLDGIPFELLSFKNGVIVIAFDYKHYDKVRDKWKYIGMKGGVWWKNNRPRDPLLLIQYITTSSIIPIILSKTG